MDKARYDAYRFRVSMCFSAIDDQWMRLCMIDQHEGLTDDERAQLNRMADGFKMLALDSVERAKDAAE